MNVADKRGLIIDTLAAAGVRSDKFVEVTPRAVAQSLASGGKALGLDAVLLALVNLLQTLGLEGAAAFALLLLVRLVHVRVITPSDPLCPTTIQLSLA